MSGLAKTSSRPGSRSPTGSAPTCGSRSPAPSACSGPSTAPSRCGSWNGSPRPPVPAGSPRNDSAPGCEPTTTAATGHPASSTPILPPLPPAPPAAPPGDDGDARAAIPLAYVAVLTSLRAQIDGLTSRLDELLDAHPDA